MASSTSAQKETIAPKGFAYALGVLLTDAINDSNKVVELVFLFKVLHKSVRVNILPLQGES